MIAKLYSYVLEHKDKLLHFLCSFFILHFFNAFLPLIFAILISVVFGIGKEIWDEKKHSGWDWYDLLADTLGIIFAIFF